MVSHRCEQTMAASSRPASSGRRFLCSGSQLSVQGAPSLRMPSKAADAADDDVLAMLWPRRTKALRSDGRMTELLLSTPREHRPSREPTIGTPRHTHQKPPRSPRSSRSPRSLLLTQRLEHLGVDVLYGDDGRETLQPVVSSVALKSRRRKPGDGTASVASADAPPPAPTDQSVSKPRHRHEYSAARKVGECAYARVVVELASDGGIGTFYLGRTQVSGQAASTQSSTICGQTSRRPRG